MRRQQAARNAEASTQVAAAGETSSIDAMRAKAEEMRRRVEQKKARKKALQQAAAAPADGRPAEPPAPWKLVSHPSTPGEWYYHNEETGETAWEAPGGVQEAQQEEAEPLWRRVEHPSEPGTFYYHNVETGETSWDVPAGFEDTAESADADKAEQAEAETEEIEESPAQDEVGDSTGASEGVADEDASEALGEEDASEAVDDTSGKEKGEDADEKADLSGSADDGAAADTSEAVDAKDQVEGAAEEPDEVDENPQQEQLDSVKEAVVAEDDKEKDVKASSGSTSAAIKEEKEAPVEKAKTVAKVGFAARLFGGKSSEEAEVENLEEEAKPEEPPYVPIDEETLSRESARANHSLEVMKEDSLRRRLVMQARRAVMRGAANTTAGGLTKDDLMKNKNGRIVSKKSHERGKMSYAKHLKGWVASVAAARAALDITGFVAVGGASEVGQKLYKKARELYDGSKASS